jgi:iron complex outermembrane receptor protein
VEILREVPGLYVTYDNVSYSVGVREMTGGFRGGTRITKIMIDGIAVNFRPDLEAFIGTEFIPVEAIQRVEVAKGPLSALYGANAFIATVNVITREPEERSAEVTSRYIVTNGNAGFGASGVATTAGLNTSLLLAVNADHVDRSGLYSRQTYPRQANMPFAVKSAVGLDGHEATANDVTRPLSAFARFDYHHDKAGDFRVEGGYQEVDSKAEYIINSILTHHSRVNVANQWGALQWHRSGRQLSARGYLGVAAGAPKDEYELFTSGNLDSSYHPNFDYRALNGLAEVSYDFGHWLQSDFGVDFELSRETVLYYTQRFYNDPVKGAFDESDILTSGSNKHEDYRQVGTYLQLRSSPFADLPDLRFTAAGRLDWIEFGDVSYPTQVSFRGAVAYRFDPKFTARVIGGRAFQTPSGTLLFAHPGFGNDQNLVGSEVTKNPDPLKPQTVNSIELVLSAQVGKFLSLEASAYYQAIDDAIRFLNDGTLISAMNGGEVETAGGELLANLQFGPFRPYASLSVSQQISAEVPFVLKNIAAFTGSPSLYSRIFGYAGVDVELSRAMLFMNAVVRWAGDRGASQNNAYQNGNVPYSLAPYATLDVTLSTGALPLISRDAPTRFSISGQNLLAADYMEPGFSGVDIPQLGTSLLFQVRQAM